MCARGAKKYSNDMQDQICRHGNPQIFEIETQRWELVCASECVCDRCVLPSES